MDSWRTRAGVHKTLYDGVFAKTNLMLMYNLMCIYNKTERVTNAEMELPALEHWQTCS